MRITLRESCGCPAEVCEGCGQRVHHADGICRACTPSERDVEEGQALLDAQRRELGLQAIPLDQAHDPDMFVRVAAASRERQS